MIAGWSSPAARQAHNLKVVGSNPTPATNMNSVIQMSYGVFRVLGHVASSNALHPIIFTF